MQRPAVALKQRVALFGGQLRHCGCVDAPDCRSERHPMKCPNCKNCSMEEAVRGRFMTRYCGKCGYWLDWTGSGHQIYNGPTRSIWTSLYTLTARYNPNDRHCFRVQWGYRGGPKISEKTARALAFNRLKNDQKLMALCGVSKGGPQLNNW